MSEVGLRVCSVLKHARKHVFESRAIGRLGSLAKHIVCILKNAVLRYLAVIFNVSDLCVCSRVDVVGHVLRAKLIVLEYLAARSAESRAYIGCNAGVALASYLIIILACLGGSPEEHLHGIRVNALVRYCVNYIYRILKGEVCAFYIKADFALAFRCERYYRKCKSNGEDEKQY